MKRSIISLLVAGLFAGTAAYAADDTETDVKATPKAAETTKSRSADHNTQDAINDTTKDAKQNSDKTAADFRKADKDNDGTLDRKEAKHMRGGVAKNFDAIDADNDGTISMEEIDTYMAAHPGKKGNM